jgi:apolipoprotein N-acyltransferase
MRLPKIDRPMAVRWALSALAAVLMFLSAPTVDLWPLMWFGMVPQIYVALTSATAKRAFWHGWLTGAIANTAAFGWMRGFLQHFGHMSALQAIPIMLLLTVYQGLEFAFLSWGIYRVRRRIGGDWPMAVVAPVVMVVIELLTPQIFPFYLAITQAWVPHVIQIADITGPLGVTFLLVAVNGALYDLLAAWLAGRVGQAVDWKRAARPAVAVAALMALVLGYGCVRMYQIDARRAAAPKVKAGLVQANVGILEKWDPREFARIVETHQRLSGDLQRAGADFIVWPESSYSYLLPRDFAQDLPPDDPRRIRRGFDKPLLFGAITRSPGPPHTFKDKFPYNTALMMDAGGRITGMYDKVFLMIFGEYIPFYESVPWFTDLFPEASNTNRGEDPAVFSLDLPAPAASAAGQPAPHYRLGPLICYEDILPGFVRRAARLRPNLFVNITNDAWFGRTAEPYQHMALAIFRSVEHRLEMVRAVNTGVSAHIDAAGRVVSKTASYDPLVPPAPEPVTLMADVAMLDGGGLYRIIGDLFGLLCLAALVVALLRKRAGGAAEPAVAPASGAARSKRRRNSR